jgi:vitamin K-dependent gamma-carboxylase
MSKLSSLRDGRRTSATRRLRRTLARPVEGASLALFRIAFGVILLWEVARYEDPSHDWVERYFVLPRYHFPYGKLDFVHPLPSVGMHVLFMAIAMAAVLVTLGLFYRAAMLFLAGALTYVFLLDATYYLNHMYLVCLLATILVAVPAHGAFSIDALRRGAPQRGSVPSWGLNLVRFQVAVPYFFGGIAKLNGDWLSGKPLDVWLARRSDLPYVGELLAREGAPIVFAWGGMLLDLLAAPLLLIRHTRPFMFGALLFFHLTNSRLFHIGIFPWFMILASTIFFPPDWPKRLLDRLSGSRVQLFAMSSLAAVGFGLGSVIPHHFSPVHAVVSMIGGAVLGFALLDAFMPRTTHEREPKPSIQRPGLAGHAVTAFVLTWVVVQCALPLRYHFIPGNTSWTEEGHRFSWRMKLNSKHAKPKLTAIDRDTGERVVVDLDRHLTRRQQDNFGTRPDLLVHFAHHLARMARRGGRDIAVYAFVPTRLNGRPPRLMIDPDVDLTRVEPLWLGHADWVLQMDDPRGALPRPRALDAIVKR